MEQIAENNEDRINVQTEEPLAVQQEVNRESRNDSSSQDNKHLIGPSYQQDLYSLPYLAAPNYEKLIPDKRKGTFD